MDIIEGVDYVQDATKMTLPDESFDTVVSFQALEHIDDTDAVIRNIYRVLKTGGYVIAAMPFMYPQHGDPSDFHRFTEEGARFSFKKAGFEVEESGKQGSTLAVISEMIRCVFLNYYEEKKGRIRTAVVGRIYSVLKNLDRKGYWHRHDIYGNVYIVCKKV